MYENNVLMMSELLTEHGNFIRAVIRSQVKNEEQVDDIYQDFFLSLAYRPIPKGVKNIKSYLYRAITNDIVDAARRVEKYKTLMHKYVECLDYSINKNTPENALIETEEINKMFKLIGGQLPRSEAQAITFRFKNNFSIKEVAKKMHVNSRTVSRYICVGLRKIQHFRAIKRGNDNDSSQS